MKVIFLEILVIMGLMSRMVRSHGYDHNVRPGCGPEDTSCEFLLIIDNTLSMMVKLPGDIEQHRHPLIIYPNGTYAARQQPECDSVTPVDKEAVSDTVTLDGSYKMVLTVNGTIPGPSITVYEGQEVVVNVTNAMFTGESLTMHWHGQHQMGTPWMDGAGSVSQCAIEWGNSFVYRFIAHPAGTFWYHAHLPIQRAEGVFGAFIVLPKPGTPLYQAEEVQNPSFDKDFVLVVQDFYQQSAAEVSIQWRYNLNRYTTNYDDMDQCFDQTYNVDGRKNTFIKPKSVLINGKGWHCKDNTTTPENEGVPLENFIIAKGQYVRFRVINSALALTLRVSVDGHLLNVIGTDSSSLKPRAVESVIVAAGERYDFWIQGVDPDETGLYWIRAEGIGWMTANRERVVPIHAEAILSYNKPPLPNSFPASQRQTCSAEAPCELLNCPYIFYPPGSNLICVPLMSLQPTLEDPPLEPTDNLPIVEKFLQFYYAPGMTPTINKMQFHPATTPPQVYPSKPWAAEVCDFDSECTQPICHCTHVLKVPTGRVVQLVFSTMAHVLASTHPIHFHGHSFQVIRVGHPLYDPVTGELVQGNDDILCPMDTCKTPVWSNSSWADGHLPDIPQSVIRKDTVTLPVGGYVVVRIFTNNPGFWFLHCHMQLHSAQGMDLIVQAGDTEEMPPTPDQFKTCGNFYWSEQEFQDRMTLYEQHKDTNEDVKLQDQVMTSARVPQAHAEPTPIDDDNGYQVALGFSITFLILAVITCIVLAVKLVNAKRGYANLLPGDMGRIYNTNDSSVLE